VQEANVRTGLWHQTDDDNDDDMEQLCQNIALFFFCPLNCLEFVQG